MMRYHGRDPRWTVRPEHFNSSRRMPVEVRADDDGYIIRALVPGKTAEDLQIEVLEDLVTLKANGTQAELEGDTLLSEIDRWGGTYRRIRLPEAVQAEQVEARVENGMLTIRLPKSEARRTKRIEVRSK